MEKYDNILTDLITKLAEDNNLDISTENGTTLWMVYAIFSAVLFDAYNVKEVALASLNPTTAKDLELDGLGLLLNFPRTYSYPDPVEFEALNHIPSPGLLAGTVFIVSSGGSMPWSFTLIADILSVAPGDTLTTYFVGDEIPASFPAGALTTAIFDPSGVQIPTVQFQIKNTLINTITPDGNATLTGYRNQLQTIYEQSGFGIQGNIEHALKSLSTVTDALLLVGRQPVPSVFVGFQTYTAALGEIIALVRLAAAPPAVLKAQFYPVYLTIAKLIERKKDYFNQTPAAGTYTGQIDVNLVDPSPLAAPLPISFVLASPKLITSLGVIIGANSTPIAESGTDSVLTQLQTALITYFNSLPLGATLFLTQVSCFINEQVQQITGGVLYITQITLNGLHLQEELLPFDQYWLCDPAFSLQIVAES